ncbi:trehalose-6-phosphate synthase [Candidatus Bipolaricaulota bacterium]|nr:trehalose-6-phosphate synthase [Candidatus Bipolaricaulota bacterium]
MIGSSTDDRLIVVSNGEPYQHIHSDEGIKQEKLAGGLTTGLDPMMKNSNNLWIAWGRGEADFEVTDDEDKIVVPDEEIGYTLKRLELSREEINGFYYGFSNSTLWPICHSFPHKANLDGENWKIYKEVNRRFAESALEEYRPGDKIWVQDYQLALVPSMIKREKPDAKIGLFWHIPWPPWENFGIIPWKQELVEGMLGADFIGFHTSWLVHNFLDSVFKLGGAANRNENIARLDSQQARVKDIPLGIDTEFFESTPEREEQAERLKSNLSSEKIVLGVDRLDYTKGIDHRIEAISTFFDKYPQYRGEVSFVERISPSRSKVKEYQDMRKKIEQGIAEINGELRNEDWVPIRYFYQHLPQEQLIPYYLAADVGLLTPLIDGMNLVAKEYVATRESGMLILSEFAGAAETLGEALQVNPYNSVGVADAVHEALTTPEEIQEKKFEKMKRKLNQMDVHWWRDRFLDEWELSLHSQK